MNDMIERMKQNEKPFGLLSEKEKQLLQVTGKRNIQVYQEGGFSFSHFEVIFHKTLTYRIRPDYQPEPDNKEMLGYADMLTSTKLSDTTRILSIAIGLISEVRKEFAEK